MIQMVNYIIRSIKTSERVFSKSGKEYMRKQTVVGGKDKEIKINTLTYPYACQMNL